MTYCSIEVRIEANCALSLVCTRRRKKGKDDSARSCCWGNAQGIALQDTAKALIGGIVEASS